MVVLEEVVVVVIVLILGVRVSKVVLTAVWCSFGRSGCGSGSSIGSISGSGSIGSIGGS